MKNRIVFIFLIFSIIIVLVTMCNAAEITPAPAEEVLPRATLDKFNFDSLVNYMKKVETLKKEGTNIAKTDLSLWGGFITADKTMPTIENAQNKAWQSLSADEKKTFIRLVFEEKGYKINPERIKGLELSSLVWDGNKLKNKNGAYLDFDELAYWISEFEFKDNQLVLKTDSQKSGKKEDERTIVFNGKGTITKSGELFVKDITDTGAVPRINLLYGTKGEIRISDRASTGNTGEFKEIDVSLSGQANLKVGDNFYRQFYSKDNSITSYRPEDGKDEEAQIKLILAGDSPSNHMFVPEAKNSIVSITDSNKIIGEIYTSRTKGIKIFHNPVFQINPVEFDKEVPYIHILTQNNKVGIEMKSDRYIGFVSEKNIDYIKMEGYGKISPYDTKKYNIDIGEYLYFRNGLSGNLGIAIKKGETYVSGNSQKAGFSADSIVNMNDLKPGITAERYKEIDKARGYTQGYISKVNNPNTGTPYNNEMRIKTDETGNYALTSNGNRVAVSSRIWEGTRVSNLQGQLVQAKSRASNILIKTLISNPGSKCGPWGCRVN
ncbi:MAG: hypothetical protein Q8N99_04835 [Nanoarchaeota archaeon]|nr:hypothetical protein [Nanoarchaeota archaeon]